MSVSDILKRGQEKGNPPEHAVSVLIRLPHLDQSIIALDSLLHDEPLAIELPNLSRNSLNLDLTLLGTLLHILVLDRNFSSLHGSTVSTGSVESGDSRSSGAAAFGEGALRGELESDLTVEVEGFEVLYCRG